VIDISETTPGIALIGAAAVTAALVVMGRALVALVRFARRVQDFLADWAGEPARGGRDQRKGVLQRLKDVEDAIEGIRRETVRNGGDTIKDAVEEIRQSVRHDSREN
jgi:hypothetical protein